MRDRHFKRKLDMEPLLQQVLKNVQSSHFGRKNRISDKNDFSIGLQHVHK